ncbi:hypothetical protein ABPG72_009515 [Tetrahymena utriculariae]
MNNSQDEVKEDCFSIKKKKYNSLDCVLSPIITRKKQESINSFQAGLQEDQNSTAVPESPFMRNCNETLNKSHYKILGHYFEYDYSLKKKIERIKIQLQNKAGTDSNQSLVQKRLDDLRKKTLIQKQFNIQKQNNNANKINDLGKFFFENDKQNNLKLLQPDQIIISKPSHKRSFTNTPYYSSNDKKAINISNQKQNINSAKQSKDASFQEEQVKIDINKKQNFNKQANSEKKRVDFCDQFYESMQKDAERQFKSNSDKSKPISQILETNCEKAIVLLNNLIQILTESILISKNSIQLDEKLALCVNLSNNSKISQLMLVIQKLQGKISYYYNDFLKCIRMMKICKNFCQLFGSLKFKISCYKYIGLGFQRLNKPKVALVSIGTVISLLQEPLLLRQFLKVWLQKNLKEEGGLKHKRGLKEGVLQMLRQSWFIKQEDQEIDSYDFIGMSYFYLGSIDKAYQYHQMMIDGIKADEEVKKISNIMLKSRRYSNYPTLQNIRIIQETPDGQPLQKTIKKSKIINPQFQLTQQEWGENISSSEDEFELPQMQIAVKNAEEQTLQKKFLSIPWNDRFVQTQIHKLEIAQELSYNKFPIGLVFKNQSVLNFKSSSNQPQLVVGPYANKIYNQELSSTYSSRQRISHQTPNREFFNYHSQQQQIKEQTQLNQIKEQYNQIVDSIELTNHLIVLKNLKKVKGLFQNLIPYLNEKYYSVKQQNAQQFKQMHSSFDMHNCNQSFLGLHKNSIQINGILNIDNQTNEHVNNQSNRSYQKQPDKLKLLILSSKSSRNESRNQIREFNLTQNYFRSPQNEAKQIKNLRVIVDNSNKNKIQQIQNQELSINFCESPKNYSSILSLFTKFKNREKQLQNYIQSPQKKNSNLTSQSLSQSQKNSSHV